MNTSNSHILFTNEHNLFTYEHNLFTYEHNLFTTQLHISNLQIFSFTNDHNQFTYEQHLFTTQCPTQCSSSQSISILDTRMSMSERCHSIFQHIPFVVKGRQRYFGHTLGVDLMSITAYDIELGNS